MASLHVISGREAVKAFEKIGFIFHRPPIDETSQDNFYSDLILAKQLFPCCSARPGPNSVANFLGSLSRDLYIVKKNFPELAPA
jgi:hypothetical protein